MNELIERNGWSILLVPQPDEMEECGFWPALIDKNESQISDDSTMIYVRGTYKECVKSFTKEEYGTVSNARKAMDNWCLSNGWTKQEEETIDE